MSISCSICEESLTQLPNDNKTDYTTATKCGHLFHYSCLSKWLERSNMCPQCRKVVLKHELIRIFWTNLNDASYTELQRTIENYDHQLQETTNEKNQAQNECEELRFITTLLRDKLKKMEKTCKDTEMVNTALKEEVSTLNRVHLENKELQEQQILSLKKQNKSYQQQLEIQKVRIELYEETFNKNVTEKKTTSHYTRSQVSLKPDSKTNGKASGDVGKNLRTLNLANKRAPLTHINNATSKLSITPSKAFVTQLPKLQVGVSRTVLAPRAKVATNKSTASNIENKTPKKNKPSATIVSGALNRQNKQ